MIIMILFVVLSNFIVALLSNDPFVADGSSHFR